MEENCIYYDKRYENNCILKERKELEEDRICEFCIAKYILNEGEETIINTTEKIKRENGKIITILED